jgi:hypothetical protein
MAGEELKLPEMPVEGESLPRIEPSKDKSAVIRQTIQLLKAGEKHEKIFKALRNLGYTYSEVDEILSKADIFIHAEQKRPFELTNVLVAGLFLLLAVGIVAVFSTGFLTGARDCGTDVLCSETLTSCSQGTYQSVLLGATHVYSVSREASSCRVVDRVMTSGSGFEQAGMEMTCYYPLVDSRADLRDRYGPCFGTLADAWKALNRS